MGSLADRFWSKVRVTPGCWEWQKQRDNKGYGRFKVFGRNQQAHRFSWELVHGSIPEGQVVRHRCDNPPCVNPDHLLAGTMADNCADRDSRGRNGYSTRTHCPRGHPYSGDNLVTRPKGKRGCRECNRARCNQNYAFRTYAGNFR